MKKLLAIILLWAWGFLLYRHVIHGTFQFDDWHFIVNNLAIHDANNISAIWQALPRPVRFITFYTFALNYHWHQLQVPGYHIVNILIHCCNATLVGWLMRLILMTPFVFPQNNMVRQRAVKTLPWVASLIFLTHPLQTQAVAYITQRFASLATFFYLLTLCLFLKARWARWQKRPAGFFWAGAGLAMMLGMMSKQIVLTVPLAALLMEYCLFSPDTHLQLKDFGKIFSKRYVWLAFLSVLIIPLMYQMNISWLWKVKVDSGSHYGDTITAGQYFLTQPRVIWTYVRLFFWPVKQHLDYDFVLSQSLWEWKTCLAFVGLTVWFGMALMLRRKNRVLSFCLLWFLGALLVESSIIPIRHVIFEHRMYLPSVSLCLALSVLLGMGVKGACHRNVMVLILGLTLSCLTFQRNRVWRNEMVMWIDNAHKSPVKARPYLNLGKAYLQKGHGTLALRCLNQALILEPDNAKALLNRGNIYQRKKDFSKALADYNQALALSPEFFVAYNNRGNMYRLMGKEDLALKDFSKAIELSSNYAAPYNNRGDLYRRQGLWRLALADYTQSLAINSLDANVKQKLEMLSLHINRKLKNNL